MGITGLSLDISKKAFALWKTLMMHRKYRYNTCEVGSVKIIPNLGTGKQSRECGKAIAHCHRW